MANVAEGIASVVAHLPPQEQERMLRIQVDPEVGEAMEQALEECERIDPDE